VQITATTCAKQQCHVSKAKSSKIKAAQTGKAHHLHIVDTGSVPANEGDGGQHMAADWQVAESAAAQR
jgi:hypothetical protein